MTISSNFILNLYRDILTEHSGSNAPLRAISFFLGAQGFNLRLRNTPLSSSVGNQTSIDSSFDYSDAQRQMDIQAEEMARDAIEKDFTPQQEDPSKFLAKRLAKREKRMNRNRKK